MTALIAVTDESERALWAQYRSSAEDIVRHRLFALYLPLARRIATRQYRLRNAGDLDYADIHQLACAGLLDAIDRFEPDRGVAFRFYGNRRIAGSIIDGVARMSEMREQLNFKRRITRDRAQSLSVREGDAQGSQIEQTLAELAEVAAGLAIGFMLEGTGMYVDDETDSRQPNAYESAVWQETLARIQSEVVGLGSRERLIIGYHYQGGVSFDQIGVRLGITKGRVSQIHKQAIAHLRRRLLNPVRARRGAPSHQETVDE